MYVKHLKTLGLSLLALVAAMAISASAAQGEWVLDGGTNVGGVLTLNLDVEALSAELLVPEVAAAVHCPGGTGLITLTTNAAMTVLTAQGAISFANCTVLDMEFCTVKSTGAAAGVIATTNVGGSGTMPSAPGTEVLFDVSSMNFAEIKFEGELCPLDNITRKVKGTVNLSMPDAAELKATHLVALDDVDLKYGDDPAELHAGDPNDANPIVLHLRKEGGGNWAVLLANL